MGRGVPSATPTPHFKTQLSSVGSLGFRLRNERPGEQFLELVHSTPVLHTSLVVELKAVSLTATTIVVPISTAIQTGML